MINWKQRIFAVLTCLFAWFPAQADNSRFEELLMPGPVIEGHADIEKECSKCHGETDDDSLQTQMCLDCHEEVAEDIHKKQGYHGLDTQIKDSECRTCHTDHKGRNTDILLLDKDHFDHNLTDFMLEGKHTSAPCSGCHLPEKKYREALSQCLDCHEDDDPHRGQFEETCDACHTPKEWNKFDFDHNETQFPLKSKHEEASCNACHPDQRYVNTPMECISCHALNDVHAGQNGNECEACHIEDEWQQITFDHNNETEFQITGSHEGLTCESCHKDSKFDKKPDKTCIGCHLHDDEHQGRNGRQCDNCHRSSKWTKLIFNHDNDTDFMLKGKHKDVLCTACHQDQVYDQNLDTTCISCHRVDDYHRGQLGERCERCHNEQGWANRVVFDHDITNFPLIGLHSVLPCSECHISGSFQGTEKLCDSCHNEDDIHKKALGPACHNCHTPNSWNIWQFDHDTQTDFVLDGGHKNLSCESCHTEPTDDEVKQSSACFTCHAQDDIHEGQFGKNCERCHTTEKFDVLK